MAGVLAMAASVEDYGVQPCKKLRKDDDHPVKTITNYFSPLVKNVAKVFSPPKSNIPDYFKSTPPTKEIRISNGICENGKPLNNPKDPASPVTASQEPLKRKRRRAKVNLQSRLSDVKPSEDRAAVDTISDSLPSNDPESACMGVGFMGSDTAALLAQICNESQLSGGVQSCELGTHTTKAGCKSKATKNSLQRRPKNDRKSRKRKFEDGEMTFPNMPMAIQTDNPNKEEDKKSVSLDLSSSIQNQSSLTDCSLEVHIDDERSSLNNDSVVTVSFEEFLKSQGSGAGQSIVVQAPVLENSPTTSNADEKGLEKSDDNPLSTKTVTVLVQVHSSPPSTISPPKQSNKLKHKKSGGKIASIFFRKSSRMEVECDPLSSDEQTPQMTLKRKSNVVIEEEDLELAVLEVGGLESVKPKSTVEERQQFMKAFRQPSSDGGKAVAKKASGKQQDLNEKPLKEKEKVDEAHTNSNTNTREHKTASKLNSEEPAQSKVEYSKSDVKNTKLKKRKRVGQVKCADSEKPEQYPPENTHSKVDLNADNLNANLNMEKSPVLEKPGVVLRKSSRPHTHVSQNRTPSKNESGEASRTATEDPATPKVNRRGRTALKNTLSGPSQVSTPKMSRFGRRNCVYKSEMILTSETQSPIRMRFTRLSVRGRTDDSRTGEDAAFTPRSKKVPNSSKKVSKAKKLVKKAKHIQHNASKSNLETEPPPRRSSRQQALSERKHYVETEDCMFVDSSSEDTPADNWKPEKKLRSLNDVLGKRRQAKSTECSVGQVVTNLVCGKKRNPPTGAISVIDDSSKDASENSQDEEQCKAKREFLKSGLPDSLKRHIAKTAATLEAYSAASLSYQAVAHVQQKEDCVRMWTLLWPSTPFLSGLPQHQTDVKDVAKLSMSLGTFTAKSSKRNIVSTDMLSGWRMEFSDVVLNYLLEEIRSSNILFPVRRFLKQFQKRHSEYCTPLTSKEGSSEFQATCSEDPEKQNKRKKEEVGDLKSKRRKATSSSVTDQTTVSEVDPTARKSMRSSLSEVEASTKNKRTRASRKKQAESPKEKIEDSDEVILVEGAASDVLTTPGSMFEDVLWTEKYQPQDSSELIGNSGAIKKLHCWLKEWKARTDREEKKSQREKKSDENSQDTWGQSDFEGDSGDEEEFLCNTVLITGPSGVGKTAAVYACAQELGFKVFEVNASCQRSGRQILSQLKEATQSHQVDKQGTNLHKPCFFNSSNFSNSPRKLNSPRKVVSSPRKPPLSPRGAQLKSSLPTNSLANFFKTSAKQKTTEETEKQAEKKKNNCESSEVKELKSTSKEVVKAAEKELSEDSTRKSATSLILFEEVDVIFEDDVGFLSAVKTFMTTTKRPVILTTSDPTFSLVFDGFFEDIYFKTPSPINIASYLHVLCLSENLRTDLKDFATLLTMNNCDIRQSILFLQFWVRSGGGYMKDAPLSICEKSNGEITPADEDSADTKTVIPLMNAHIPKCDTGCVESLLGLKNILSPSEDLMSFIKCNITNAEEWTTLVLLLQNFQMKNVNFIFNNLELLLPLPVQILPEPNVAPETEGEKADPSALDPKSALKEDTIKHDYSEDGSPVKMSMRMKCRKKLGLFNDPDLFECDSKFLTLHNQELPFSELETNVQLKPAIVKPHQECLKKTLSPAEQQCSILVSQCLDSLMKFVDDISFLDSCLLTNVEEQTELKDMDYNWSGGRIKNGLCDGHRVESKDWWSTQNCGELKAMVEVLSFRNCYSSISDKMESSLDKCRKLGKDPVEELTLRLPKHRDAVSFSQSGVDARIAQKRLSLVKSVFSNRSFMTVGNRQASIVEYLPILRNICKTEKLKEQGKLKRRFLHYCEGISLELPKATLQSLAADFP
ncbi:ATPase family AAA domain-containing protein 5 [Ambystoma mexicanum]|uniref:ATPase family AAA domain-containing protein 5 n=1 Tax=Ambystoma mexicanum TaxID=8296 RepID=UPI0037E7DF3B